MATKNNVSAMVSGLGMAMRFLIRLIEAIEKNGGFAEMLQAISADNPNAEETIDALAKIIVKSEWRVPRSLVEKLTVEEVKKNGWSGSELDWHRMFFWEFAQLTERFGIPITRFGEEGEPPISKEIEQQLLGQTIHYPCIIQWNGEPHVLVKSHGYDVDLNKVCNRDLTVADEDAYIYISPTKYFAMDQ